MSKNEKLSEDLLQFKGVFSDIATLLKLGENFILKWYGSRRSQNLNSFRYVKYNQVIARQKLCSNFELASLPPTTEAAQLHLKRVYLQVQSWLGNNLDPREWGWVEKDGYLDPQRNSKDIAPDFIIKLLFCGCKSVCSKTCTCKKVGMKCSSSCTICIGQYCDNATNVSFVENDECIE